MTWAKGKHNMQFGGELAFHDVEDPQPVPARRSLPVRRRAPPRAPATRSPISCSASSAVRPGHRRVQGLQVVLRVGVRPGRLQGQRPADVEPGRPVRAFAAVAREGRPHHALDVADYQNNVHSTMFPAAPRGETFRGDAGVREDGIEPSASNTASPVSASRGTSPATARPASAAAAARSTISIATANRATAPSTRRRSTCGWPSPVRRGPFSDPYRGRSDFNLITDATIGTQQAIFPTPVLISTLGEEYKTPVTYNFNLTFEREVMQGIMARAAYVGSRNRNGRLRSQLNSADRDHPRRDHAATPTRGGCSPSTASAT